MHDDRLLTLDDTVEFFNVVLGLKLVSQEKKDIVAFLCFLLFGDHDVGRGHV